MNLKALRWSPLCCVALLALAACGGGGGGGSTTPPPSGPVSQTISFAMPGQVARTYGDPQFTNAASGGAGAGAITYSSGTTSVAAVDSASGIVTILAAGTTVITAVKAADANHLSAQATYILDVAPAPQVIAFAQPGPIAKNFGDVSFTNTASGGAGTGAIAYTSADPAVASVDAATGLVSVVGGGSTQITASKAADANHASAQASYFLNVARIPQRLTFAQPGPLTKTYGDPPFLNPAVGSNGSGAISYSSTDSTVLTVNAASGAVAIAGAGTAKVVATRAADTNYLETQITYDVNVARAPQTIAFAQPGPVARTYGDPMFVNTAAGGAGSGAISYSSGNPLVATVNPVSGAVTIIGAGIAVIGADKAASVNHSAAATSYQLNVAKAPQVIAFALAGPVEKHTVDSPFTNSASGGAGTGATTYATDNPSVASVNGATGTVGIVTAGVAHITASKATDSNYLAAQATYTLDVFQSGTSLGFTAWLGTDDTEVRFPAAAAGDDFVRGNFPVCDAPLLVACATATATLLGSAPVVDTVAKLNLWTQVWLRRAGQSYPAVQLSRSRFGPVRDAQMVEFDNQLWMVGAPPNATTWSSYDGRSWVMRSTSDAYGPRTGSRATVFDNKLWVVGGYKTTGTTGDTSDVWSSPDGLNWTQVASAAPFAPRDKHGLVAFNGRLWVVGGQQSDGYVTTTSFNDVWSSADGVNWTRATAGAPFSPRSPQLMVFNNRLWVVGGHEGRAARNDAWSTTDGVSWTQAGSGIILGTAEGLRATVLGTRLYITGAEYSDYYRQKVFYTDTGNSWTYATVDVPFGRRTDSAFFSFKNRIWLIGGDTPIEQICCTRSDVWSSADGASWVYEHTSAPYSPSSGQRMVEFANRLWLLGPGNDGGVTQAWSSADGDDWVKSPSAASLPPRQWPGMAVFSGKLWMIGGLQGDTGNSASFKNDVWSSTDGNTWTQVSAAAPFSARYAHSLFALNGRLFLVGGVEGPPYTRKSDVWSTVDGVVWTLELDNAPFGPRAALRTVSFNGRIWLVGGFDSTNQLPADVWSTADGVSWRQDAINEPRVQRYEHELTEFAGRLWLTGGRGTNYVETRDLVSSVDGIHWISEAAPAWTARTSHATVAFGGHMFLFGGLGVTVDENRENEMWRSDDGIHWRLRNHNVIAVP